MKKPFELYVLLFFLFLLGINASIGGFLMIFKSDGSLLQMSLEWLKNTPFDTYLIPGLILFLFGGLLPFLSIIGLLSKGKLNVFNFLNIYHDKFWGWAYSIYSGIVIIIWIIVQMLITQYFWLQPVIISIGLIIIIFSLMPRVMHLYNVKQN